MKEPPPSPGVDVARVAGLDSRIRVFRCGRIVDAFAVITDRFVVLIDTLISPETAEGMISHLQDVLVPDRTLLVVNTHGDWDHSWGNGAFDGDAAVFPAPIIGHRNTGRFLDREEARTWLLHSRQESPGWYDKVEIRLPTLEVERTTAIRGGDLSLHLVETPGHTPDHLSVWIAQIRLLLAGDAAEMPIPFLDERSSLPDLRRSLQLMRDLQPDMVLYSHGAGMTSVDLIDHNLWYFQQAEHRCRNVLLQMPGVDPETVFERLDWPLDEVLPAGQLVDDVESRDFYEQTHRRAIQFMVRWLQTRNQKP